MDRERLGAYRLERLLGRGGMGAVYLAHDARLTRDVALKILSPTLASEPGFQERFLAEARACSRLNHSNITTIHEIGEAEGLHYIAFEYVEGENLESLLAREGPMPPGRALEVALALAEALAHAHERGVVHRDLKPANVIITPSGTPKILDFGLAKNVPLAVATESETLLRLTQAGMIVGTIAYMSPEQALGEAVDARGDVFSLGCLVYEMLAGMSAFGGGSATQVLSRLLHGEPKALGTLRPGTPPALSRVVKKTLQKRADERYASMSALAEDLRQIAEEEGTSSGHRRLRTSSRATSRHRRPRLWLGAAAALGLAVAGLLFWQGARSRPSPADDAVAVLYFENLSDPEDAEQTARMLAELLTSELAGSETLHVTSRQRLHDVARAMGLDATELDRQVATDVARRAGVGTMILGQVAEAGDRMLATAELVDTRSGRSLASQRAHAASSEDVFVLAESLGEQVREELSTLTGNDVARETRSDPDTAPTVSLEAYRRFVEGETALHAGDLEGAVESLEEAIRLDPSFSLAQFRLSMAGRWLSDGLLAHQAARRAAASVSRAPAYLRDVIEANAFYQDGAFSQAIPLLAETLARDPDQKEALYILGQIYFHSSRDGDVARALELLEHLLALDPGFHQVYDRVALGYAFEGRLDLARERLEGWEARAPEKVAGLRSILATIEGQPEEALGFGQTFSWIEGPLFQASAAMMASRWDVARRLVDQDLDEWRSDHLRAWAFRNRAVFLTYVGEFDAALEAYRAAGQASGFRTHEGQSGGVPASALQLSAELLELAGETAAAREATERALRIEPESYRGLYYAGRMALADGDTDAATRHLESLTRVADSQTSRAARSYLDALEGELALAEGDPERARERFEAAVDVPLMLDWASTCSSSGAAIRDGLVRTYLALGRRPEAMRTLQELLASGAERVDHPVLYAKALYRLGTLAVESGRPVEGRRHLERFLALWGDAGWELPIVDDARNLIGQR